MKYLTYFSFIFIMVGGVAAQDVNSFQQRVLTLNMARKLLEVRQMDFDNDEISQKNPFSPVWAREATKSEAVSVQILSDRDLLISLTSQLTATGSMQSSGVSTLLFGQKKFKVGDFILIVFQGVSYELEVVSIERTNYTLRYKNEHINLPIKTPSNIPVNKS